MYKKQLKINLRKIYLRAENYMYANRVKFEQINKI